MASPAQPADAPVSGGVWAPGAGHTQTSGTPAEYAEYTQWVNFDYTRNSYNLNHQPTNDFRSLVTFSAVNVLDVMGTFLHFNIIVHNSCKIITGTFSNNSSYQAQKFSVLGQNADKVGYTYDENAVFGTASGIGGASSLYCFGPQGSIITTQPMIRRNLKKVTDVAYSLTQTGSCAYLAISGDLNCSPYSWGQCDDIGQPYDFYTRVPWGMDGYPGDLVTGTVYPYANLHAGWPFKMMGGGYAVSSEPGYLDNGAGLQNLIEYIETNCGYLDDPGYWNRFLNPIPTASNGFYQIQEADRLAVNPYYDTSHHDYT